jgi:hypothetical protein
MSEVRQATNVASATDNTPLPESNADSVTFSKLMVAVYGDMGKFGLGPDSVIQKTYTDRPLDLPAVDIFDTKKIPIIASDTPSDQPGQLDLPFKVEPPALRYEGDGYTVAIAPTGDPLKKQGGIEVSGTFSNP